MIITLIEQIRGYKRLVDLNSIATITLLLLFVLLGTTACVDRAAPSSAAADRVLVAASIAPLADFAQQVGGDQVQVITLVPPGASPHTYELTPTQAEQVTKARLLALNGVDLEYWADKVSALIVIPAAAAYQLTEDFRRMMILAVIIGNFSAIIGLFLSYGLNTASGATIVLTATMVFLISALLSPRRWRRSKVR